MAESRTNSTTERRLTFLHHPLDERLVGEPGVHENILCCDSSVQGFMDQGDGGVRLMHDRFLPSPVAAGALVNGFIRFIQPSIRNTTGTKLNASVHPSASRLKPFTVFPRTWSYTWVSSSVFLLRSRGVTELSNTNIFIRSGRVSPVK